ncbi:hypothetical protein [Embleya sp. NBC_00896]|uniref:hypothetical protein n=1 Tax=Embleya sp. NBC_00896 TaxID=2975961 RepID=UPI002F9111EB|nr:hypothetical protein OG928_44815 [Embleya sp. NBC_00896]
MRNIVRRGFVLAGVAVGLAALGQTTAGAATVPFLPSLPTAAAAASTLPGVPGVPAALAVPAVPGVPAAPAVPTVPGVPADLDQVTDIDAAQVTHAVKTALAAPVLPDGVPAELPAGVPAELPSGVPAELPAGVPAELSSSVPADLPADLPSGLPSAPLTLPGTVRTLPAPRTADLPSVGDVQSADSLGKNVEQTRPALEGTVGTVKTTVTDTVTATTATLPLPVGNAS